MTMHDRVDGVFRHEMAMIISKVVGHMAYAGMMGRIDDITTIVAEFDSMDGVEASVSSLQQIVDLFSGLEDGLGYASLFLEGQQASVGAALNVALALDTDGES